MSVNHIKNLIVLVLTLGVLILCSCATAPPVQEMSDARQALQAAEAAGAHNKAPLPYGRAQTYIERAESALQMGDFFEARERALEAKTQALEARSKAIEKGP
ncbi:MAG: DUF4398 domain-containing protein [Gammaproteobacteria bacterium]|nr:DUF4398 domain-containing protein [Gammaproteobacteria bacterium]